MDDTYLFHLSTSVTAVGSDERGRWIETEESILHPQGGGQPSDVGTIDGAAAVARSIDYAGVRYLRHYFEDQCPAFEVGQRVTMELDVERRMYHAALHTAGHLIDAVVTARGFVNRMGHHFPGEARVEFKARPLETLSPESVTDEVCRHIEAALPVQRVERDGERYIAIGSFEPGRCGGTHVRSTADLAEFTIRSLKVKKGVMRVGYDVAHRPL